MEKPYPTRDSVAFMKRMLDRTNPKGRELCFHFLFETSQPGQERGMTLRGGGCKPLQLTKTPALVLE